MALSIDFIEILDKLEPEVKKAMVALYGEIEKQKFVTKDEFYELVKVVNELAQKVKELSDRLDAFEKVTNENFNRVWTAIHQLAEAQRRTEERLNQLAERVDQLTVRVDQLAEAQRKTEERLNQLAEAQRKTEKEVEKLARGLKSLQTEVGGLAHTIGYRLEDEAIKSLPEILKNDFGIIIKNRLRRDYLETPSGQFIEVNIFGEARKNGKEYLVIGEAKSQLKKRDIDNFIRLTEKLKQYFDKELIRVLITYQTSPPVKSYAKDKGIKIYFSYEL